MSQVARTGKGNLTVEKCREGGSAITSRRSHGVELMGDQKRSVELMGEQKMKRKLDDTEELPRRGQKVSGKRSRAGLSQNGYGFERGGLSQNGEKRGRRRMVTPLGQVRRTPLRMNRYHFSSGRQRFGKLVKA